MAMAEREPEFRPRRIAVIGGGSAGMGCALSLRRDGHAVTLFDPGDPMTGTSSGNAGVISLAGCLPTATPNMIKRVPQMLMDPYGPLSVRVGYLPKIAPWLLALLRNSTMQRIRRNSMAKSALLDRAMQAWIDQAAYAGPDAEALIRRTGLLKVYEQESTWQSAERFDIPLMRECGRRFEVVGADELRQLEPALAPIFKHGLYFDDNGSVTHPGRMIALFHDALKREGGEIVKRPAIGFEPGAAGGHRVLTDDGVKDVDALVIAAGAWSGELLKRFGKRFIFDAERGYHIMLKQPEPTLNRPVALMDDSIFVSPMEHGLRMTTGVELAGLEAPADYTRARRMVERVTRAVKGAAPERQSEWLGFRPSAPSSVPYVGSLKERPGVYYAFGGGHIGMTLGPAMGAIVADLVAGRDPGLDLGAYSVDR